MGWFTKTVEVERVVERVVLGNPEPVKLYRAYKIVPVPTLYFCSTGMEVLGYYHTCEQAFAEHPDADVDAVKLWKVGKVYVKDLKVAEVKVQPKPKPKREKGKVKP